MNYQFLPEKEKKYEKQLDMFKFLKILIAILIIWQLAFLQLMLRGIFNPNTMALIIFLSGFGLLIYLILEVFDFSKFMKNKHIKDNGHGVKGKLMGLEFTKHGFALEFGDLRKVTFNFLCQGVIIKVDINLNMYSVKAFNKLWISNLKLGDNIDLIEFDGKFIIDFDSIKEKYNKKITTKKEAKIGNILISPNKNKGVSEIYPLGISYNNLIGITVPVFIGLIFATYITKNEYFLILLLVIGGALRFTSRYYYNRRRYEIFLDK